MQSMKLYEVQNFPFLLRSLFQQCWIASYFRAMVLNLRSHPTKGSEVKSSRISG